MTDKETMLQNIDARICDLERAGVKCFEKRFMDHEGCNACKNSCANLCGAECVNCFGDCYIVE